jgi:hypothetical protein
LALALGEIYWLKPLYSASGEGIIRIIDESIDPSKMDNLKIRIKSKKDKTGIIIKIQEKDKNSGIFEGVVKFTTTGQSNSPKLLVSDEDMVTAIYDSTNRSESYSPNERIIISATTAIGSPKLPALERVPASNLRVLDKDNKELSIISKDQHVQITADLFNNLNNEQPFAYMVQISDSNGVTVKTSRMSSSIGPYQTCTVSQLWIPDTQGTYNITIYVWESVDNPSALSPTLSITMNVK